MKFICERDILAKEITIAQEIISTKNAISILSNVYLETIDSSLLIRATDIKVSFETRIPVSVVEAGSTTVFCDKLLGILSSIPEGEVEFEESNSKITIRPTFKKIKFNLKSIASDKFPELPDPGTIPFFSVPLRDLKDMISQTIFAISDDETRYFMNGVFFEKQDPYVVMVATDGRRLAYIQKSMEEGIPDFKGIIIPPKILNLILKRASDEGSASLAVTEKNIFVKFGSYLFSSVLIEGQFPNYRRVIPENQAHHFVINRKETLEALKRVSLLVEQKSRRIYLNVKPGVLSLLSEESDIGAANEEIPCQYDGEEVSIALNYRYLEEPLRVMNDDSIAIYFTEPTRAITIKSLPEKDFFHIVMPMQVDQ
ncbi:MAG TPA: DNA polymerase III subunit beta [Termitinemataceae bacterium]|nr:DNA polymerase III subunit beta [Termitinemataceae bacterium]HOM22208.1 DNA polymerase III subunit beta [Termitinemataceae bacterium]HPP99370.1 DNA polymerase III subunit beta [Termitinemataceae bacterium]